MQLTHDDKLILELLRENSRRSITEIADIIGVSRPTVRQHIDRLIRNKVIRRFTIDVAMEENHHPSGVRAMFDIRLKRNVCGTIFSSIAEWHELVSCWSLSGSTDMRILIEAVNQAEIERLRDRLARHPEVAALVTTFVLKTWCERISGIHETAPEEYIILRKEKVNGNTSVTATR